MHSSGASFLPTGKGFSLHPYLVLPFNWGGGEGGGRKVPLETYIAKTSELNVKSKPQYLVPT